LINIYPILTTYFYYLNVTRPPLNDKRVRLALAMAIERKAITETVTRAGEIPAFCFTPSNTAGFTATARLREDPAAARRLLAEAGYPDGKNFPNLALLYNTLQSHKAIAEAVQEMWRKNLNIHVTLQNAEWKVYLDEMQHTNYDICRGGWGADYVDPGTFMDIFLTDSGNNNTGWSNAEYDRLCHLAASTGDTSARYAAYDKAETILLDEMPIIPIYVYSNPRLIQPNVKGWYPNLLDTPDYRSIYLVPQTH
jgi:oligopeptide transport system substrate-binding protein